MHTLLLLCLELRKLRAHSLGLLQDMEGLLHLALELLLRLQENEELAVVHLQHHTGDLAGELGLVLGDGGEELLADHLLLHGWWRRSQDSGIQWCTWCAT